jgi:tagatose-1,6-bisphosphate aldolase
MGAAGRERVSLSGIATAGGRFRVLAVDHRDSLRAFIEPDRPGAVAHATLVDLKIELVRMLGPLVSGVMLEPEYSIPQVLDAGALPNGVGFVAALESQGYLVDPSAAPTTLLDGWSVRAAADSGAAAVKLLLPFNPDHDLARRQEAVAQEVIGECRRVGIPLVLEPLVYGLATAADRPRVVRETVARFSGMGPDVLKLPFPVDPDIEPDRTVWRRACTEITRLCPMPWTLLSGGGSFAAFRDQLEVALESGCAGFMVGRAVWGEAARADATTRASIIEDVVAPRLVELSALTAEA